MQLYVELLSARFNLLDASTYVQQIMEGGDQADSSGTEPEGSISDAVCAIVYAAPRTELKELQQLREMLMHKVRFSKFTSYGFKATSVFACQSACHRGLPSLSGLDTRKGSRAHVSTAGPSPSPSSLPNPLLPPSPLGSGQSWRYTPRNESWSMRTCSRSRRGTMSTGGLSPPRTLPMARVRRTQRRAVTT
jgi:hypothetical protein